MPFQFRKEAIEEDLNSNFPSQGQGNPPLYYSLSEVVVPTYSINNVAEGTSLPETLQTAWDFSTGSANLTNSVGNNLVSNTGFWQVNLTVSVEETASVDTSFLYITDLLTQKTVYRLTTDNVAATGGNTVTNEKFVVFLRSGDSLQATVAANHRLAVWYRQIADVNGNLVNPLGFSFA